MKPVHTFMLMVQCPLCRYTFMRQGDECCWRCAPPAAAPTHQELEISRAVRRRAEISEGAVGSLAGLGFAPVDPPPIIFEPPLRKGRAPLTSPVLTDHGGRYPVSAWVIARTLIIVGWLCYVGYLVIEALGHRTN